MMLDAKIIDQLRELGHKVKALLPNVNGQVQFNVGRDQPVAKVNVNLSDVTEAKK